MLRGSNAEDSVALSEDDNVLPFVLVASQECAGYSLILFKVVLIPRLSLVLTVLR